MLEIQWWKNCTPLQRVIIAVLRGAMIERSKQLRAKEFTDG